MDDEIENLWDGLLSRQPDLVQATFEGLTKEEQEAVLAHLKKMAGEAGWHPEQVKSAQAALEALQGKG